MNDNIDYEIQDFFPYAVEVKATNFRLKGEDA
jgi:hypothetical protein